MELICSVVKSDFEPGFFCSFDLLEVYHTSVPSTCYFFIYVKIMILAGLLNFFHVIAKSR